MSVAVACKAAECTKTTVDIDLSHRSCKPAKRVFLAPEGPYRPYCVHQYLHATSLLSGTLLGEWDVLADLCSCLLEEAVHPGRCLSARMSEVTTTIWTINCLY